jgi:glycosyltransferase involved in cell wall biosynthesis
MFSQASGPKVAILLCTYNGARYLAEQLDSHAAQTVAHWEVQVSDDGSSDATRAILDTCRTRWGAARLHVHQGPGRGFAANFLSLVCRPELEADFFAYSDQDDIWHADKLERALRWLQSVPADVPALYCARTRLVDAAGHATGLSPWFSRPTGFANALLQNVASGNTMVFNSAARRLLQEAGQDVDVAAHDWWTYMVVTGCGGRVFFDAQPALDYRQHDTNVIGMNGGWGARVKRIRMLWHGRFRRWNAGHIAALDRLEHRLTPENREILGHFRKLREVGLLGRIVHFQRSGIYRQTLPGNIGLVAAVVFKKL